MARNHLIQLRRDTEANWTSTDPVLAAGEVGLVTDTNELVVGDGATAFSSLARFIDKATASGTYGTAAADLGFTAKQDPVTDVVTIFASGHGFTKQSAGGTQSDDTSDYILGSQSFKLVTDGDNSAVFTRKSNFTAVDATGKHVVVWLKVTGMDDLSELILYLSSDTSGLTNYWNWTIDTTGTSSFLVDGEWARVTLNWGDSATVGSPNRASIQSAQLRVRDDNTAAVTVNYNGIAFADDPSAGVVSITFDDGWESQFTQARKKMDEYALPGTAYVIPDLIGTSGKMTEANLRQLQDLNGWEIACHGATTYTSMTSAERLADWKTVKRWLADRGLRGVDGLAYVGGQFDADVLEDAQRVFSYCRSTHSYNQETYPVADPYRLRVLNVFNSTTTTQIANAVDDVASDGSWLILVFHKIVTTPGEATEFSIANFGTVIDDIAADGVTVRTVGDVIRHGI